MAGSCGIFLGALSLITSAGAGRARPAWISGSPCYLPASRLRSLLQTSRPMLKFIKELFGKSEINQVAEQLANELARRYPPSMASGEGRRLSPQAVTNILESVINKAVTRSNEWDLGVVGKAKLGNSLRWALKEKGIRRNSSRW